MDYQGNIIRPPSEANSIILQATLGCSHNKCSFCGTYKGQRFRIKPDSIIFEDIRFASQYCKNQRRIFLCDGDALIIPQKRLLNILIEIKKKLPWVTRVGMYANSKSIKLKTLDELITLKSNGLGILYMGLETGDDITLKRIQKGVLSETMIKMGKKVKAAGIKLSITVLLGIAGNKRSKIHAFETGRVLSEIDPDYVGALSLMLLPNTLLYKDYMSGKFILLSPAEMLTELRNMINATNLSKGLFHANHASNYLPVKARLPRDKEKTLDLLDKAINGRVGIKPEFLRAL